MRINLSEIASHVILFRGVTKCFNYFNKKADNIESLYLQVTITYENKSIGKVENKRGVRDINKKQEIYI